MGRLMDVKPLTARQRTVLRYVEEIHFLCMDGVILLPLAVTAAGNARNEGTPWQRFFTISAAAVWAGIMGILYCDFIL